MINANAFKCWMDCVAYAWFWWRTWYLWTLLTEAHLGVLCQRARF